MKTIAYSKNSVRAVKCPYCDKKTYAWQSSGMSMCFPHFYCNKCSNVIFRVKDQELVMNNVIQEKLEIIQDDLPKISNSYIFLLYFI